MQSRSTIALLTAAALIVPAAGAGAQSFVDRIEEIAHVRAAHVRVERYQRGGGREEQVERSTKTVRIGSDGELDVANIAGDIVVTRGGGSDATIEVVKTSRGSSIEDAKQMLQLVQVDITERPGRAEVRARYPRGDENMFNRRRNVNVSVAYTISAPAGTRLTVKSVSGSVRVRDIKGDLTAESVSGNVQVANGGRVVATKSVSGDVEIVDTQVDGGLDAGSVSGSVTLRKVKARRLDLGSVSGGVTLADVECERANVQSVSGDIRFEGPLARNGRYELKSHSGEVRVAVAGTAGFEVDANTFSGDVRSDFPITIQGDDRRRRHSVHGVYGDGSAILNLNTFSGNIVITKR
jgi:hypothetical protein